MGERANRLWRNMRDQSYSDRYDKTYRGDYEEKVSKGKLGRLESGKGGERNNK